MIIGPCRIVSGGERPWVLEEGAVRVVGAHIAQVGPAGSLAVAFPDETVWPAAGRVLMPGLVNAHAHLVRHLARGLGLIGGAWDRYERALSPEDVHWAAKAALAEGLRHGITTVCDFHRSASCLELSLLEIADAASRLGVRVATCYGASEEDTPAERRAALTEGAAVAQTLLHRRDGRVRALLGVRVRTLAGVDRLLSEARGAGDHAIHVDLAIDATPGERWAQSTALAADTAVLWAHAERAPRDLLALARERGDGLAATGAAAASSLAREPALAWGSDGGLNAPPLGDAGAFAESVPHEAHYRRLMVSGPRWAAPHFGDCLGEIAPGSPADLVLVDYHPASELSARTVPAHLVAGLLRAPVSGVMVGGEVVLDRGEFVSVDEVEIAARARECAQRLWRRLG